VAIYPDSPRARRIVVFHLEETHRSIGVGGQRPCVSLWGTIEKAFEEVPSVSPEDFSLVPELTFNAAETAGLKSPRYSSRIRFVNAASELMPSQAIDGPSKFIFAVV
jgi:hypothetical protein